MAQNFRSALNGFNREDVVHYLEYVNNKHAAEINELTSEIALLKAKLDAVPEAPPADQLEQLQDENLRLYNRITELEQQLQDAASAATPAAAPQSVVYPVQPLQAAQELEAYRRAERTERMARERAEQIFRQTNEVLSNATAKVDNASSQIGTIADQVRQQLDLLQHAVGSSRQALQDAAATMYTINPTDSNK